MNNCDFNDNATREQVVPGRSCGRSVTRLLNEHDFLFENYHYTR